MKRVFSILLVVAMCLSSVLTLGVSVFAADATVKGPEWSVDDRAYSRDNGYGLYFRPVVNTDGTVTPVAYRTAKIGDTGMSEGDIELEPWVGGNTWSVGKDGFLSFGTTRTDNNSLTLKFRYGGTLKTSEAQYVCVSYRVVGLKEDTNTSEKYIHVGDHRDWDKNRIAIDISDMEEGVWKFAYEKNESTSSTLAENSNMCIQVTNMADTGIHFEIDFIGFAATEAQAKAMKAEHDAFVAAVSSSTFVPAPSVSLASGAYDAEQTLTVTAKDGVEVYYTTNGSEPSATNGTKYTAPVTIPVDNDKAQTYKFVGIKDGNASNVVTRTYNVTNLCKAPTIYPLGEYFPAGTKITIKNNEPDAEIYYTTNGQTPTTASTKYTAPFDITLDANGKATIKAIAVKEGKGDSEVVTRSVTKQGDDYYYWVFPNIEPRKDVAYRADGWDLLDGYKLQNDTDGSLKLLFKDEGNGQYVGAIFNWYDRMPGRPNSSYPYVKVCYKSTVDVDLAFSFDFYNNLGIDRDDQGNPVGNGHAYHRAVKSVTRTDEYTTVILNMEELCKIWDRFGGGVLSSTIYVTAKEAVTEADQFNLMYVAFCATEEQANGFDMVSIPSFSQSGGFYTEVINVELTTGTAGAEIYYTTDGTIPSKTNGTKYTGAISLNKDTTIKAIAVKDGMIDSAVITVAYEISLKAKAPEVSVPSGKYTTEQEITITTKTDGAKIYYTTDGSAPTAENGTLYTGAFKLSKTCILRVVAVCEGMENSTVTSVNYKFELATTEETTTAAPTDGASTDDTNKTDDKGCASVIGFGTALPVVLAMGAAVLLGKKKED